MVPISFRWRAGYSKSREMELVAGSQWRHFWNLLITCRHVTYRRGVSENFQPPQKTHPVIFFLHFSFSTTGWKEFGGFWRLLTRRCMSFCVMCFPKRFHPFPVTVTFVHFTTLPQKICRTPSEMSVHQATNPSDTAEKSGSWQRKVQIGKMKN